MNELHDYLKATGLSVKDSDIKFASRLFDQTLEEVRRASIPASPTALDRLYTFRVPKLSADGSCSLVDEMEEAPYDLSVTLGGRGLGNTAALMTLSALVETCMDAIRVDWLGVYQSRGDSLVKLAYRGAPSRAEFPLTAEFAKKSNNVTVALFGKPVVIGDVRAHAAAGGAYYECAPTVRSEACLPILSNEGRVVGIIDAEHSVEQTFDAERLAFMSVLACAVVAHLPGQ